MKSMNSAINNFGYIVREYVNRKYIDLAIRFLNGDFEGYDSKLEKIKEENYEMMTEILACFYYLCDLTSKENITSRFISKVESIYKNLGLWNTHNVLQDMIIRYNLKKESLEFLVENMEKITLYYIKEDESASGRLNALLSKIWFGVKPAPEVEVEDSKELREFIDSLTLYRKTYSAIQIKGTNIICILPGCIRYIPNIQEFIIPSFGNPLGKYGIEIIDQDMANIIESAAEIVTHLDIESADLKREIVKRCKFINEDAESMIKLFKSIFPQKKYTKKIESIVKSKAILVGMVLFEIIKGNKPKSLEELIKEEYKLLKFLMDSNAITSKTEAGKFEIYYDLKYRYERIFDMKGSGDIDFINFASYWILTKYSIYNVPDKSKKHFERIINKMIKLGIKNSDFEIVIRPLDFVNNCLTYILPSQENVNILEHTENREDFVNTFKSLIAIQKLAV